MSHSLAQAALLWRALRTGVLALLCGFTAAGFNGCSGESHLEVLASNRHQARGDAWNLESQAFQQLVDKTIQPGWHVSISAISERSFAAESLYDETIPAYSIVGTNLYQQEQALKKARQDLKNVLAVLDSNRKGSDRTEIIAAASAAAERFDTDKTASRKLLVIISSGFEQSSVVNMADYSLNLNDEMTDRIIGHLKTLGTMPHLPGVDVCMAGITAGDRRWADHKRLLNISRFWHVFFQAAGARLASYNPSLKGCHEIPR